jgi:hypothetical protein
MSDTPVTLHGSSGPPSDGFVAPSTPNKPWRAPLVIESSEAQGTEKAAFLLEGTIGATPVGTS